MYIIINGLLLYLLCATRVQLLSREIGLTRNYVYLAEQADRKRRITYILICDAMIKNDFLDRFTAHETYYNTSNKTRSYTLSLTTRYDTRLRSNSPCGTYKNGVSLPGKTLKIWYSQGFLFCLEKSENSHRILSRFREFLKKLIVVLFLCKYLC